MTGHQHAMLVMHFRDPGNEETKCVLGRRTSRATGKHSAQLPFSHKREGAGSVGNAEYMRLFPGSVWGCQSASLCL